MQPNYEEMMKKQQQDYQRSRDPFEYGRQVSQRRYSEIMSDIDTRRQSTQQTYGDLYSQARQQAVRGQAAGGPTLSGGMGQQQRDFVSAIEMQQLGQIGASREGAMRDLYSQGQAAFSNAQLEGQQASQMELQNQQTQLQLIQQRQAILDSDIPEEQKQAQLEAISMGGQDVEQADTGGFGWLGWKDVFDGDTNFGEVASAVLQTAVAGAAVYFLGPSVIKLAGTLGKGFLKGAVTTTKAGKTKFLLGSAGWKNLTTAFKQRGLLRTAGQFPGVLVP
jgi:hypothetical protein